MNVLKAIQIKEICGATWKRFRYQNETYQKKNISKTVFIFVGYSFSR